jgi:hypothetical protein
MASPSRKSDFESSTKKKKLSRSQHSKIKRTYKKTMVLKKKGGKVTPPRKHIKVVTYSSRVHPEKPYYKIFVFDQINGDIIKAFNDYIKKTVNETEEDLIAMRDNYNNPRQIREKDAVSVYGFEMIPTTTKKK